MSRWPLFCALLAAACGPASEPDPNAQVVVLTFDDGPVTADFARGDLHVRSKQQLLAPLQKILTTLAARELRAVFYLEGPGSEQSATALDSVYAAGVGHIAAAGHILGYHAFNHAPALWGAGGNLNEMTATADLDTLEYHTQRWAAAHDAQMTPIFRQPYGGAGEARLSRVGKQQAEARGWVYHGFNVDSVDWTQNATADKSLVELLPVSCEAARKAYVQERLEDGLLAQLEQDTIDVIFHVNQFTAANLEAWLETIDRAAAQRGRAVRFAIPQGYLATSDSRVDLSFLQDIGRGAACD